MILPWDLSEIMWLKLDLECSSLSFSTAVVRHVLLLMNPSTAELCPEVDSKKG